MGPGKRMVDVPRGAEISLLPPPGASPVVVVPRPQAGVVRPAAQVGEAVQGGVAHALRGRGHVRVHLERGGDALVVFFVLFSLANRASHSLLYVTWKRFGIGGVTQYLVGAASTLKRLCASFGEGYASVSTGLPMGD